MVLPPYGFHVQCPPGHDKIVAPDLQVAIPA
jgi:hypothetical protein